MSARFICLVCLTAGFGLGLVLGWVIERMRQ